MANIATSGSFLPTTVNTPVDARIVINSKSEIVNMEKPYVGMVFYVKDEDAFYVVVSLKSSSVNGIIVNNTAVNEYRALIESMVEFATPAEVQNMLKNVGII